MKWKAAKYTDGPNECGYYTAGIDVPIVNSFGKLDWHYHAIEFHDKSKDVAEARRDIVLKAMDHD